MRTIQVNSRKKENKIVKCRINYCIQFIPTTAEWRPVFGLVPLDRGSSSGLDPLFRTSQTHSLTTETASSTKLGLWNPWFNLIVFDSPPVLFCCKKIRYSGGGKADCPLGPWPFLSFLSRWTERLPTNLVLIAGWPNDLWRIEGIMAHALSSWVFPFGLWFRVSYFGDWLYLTVSFSSLSLSSTLLSPLLSFLSVVCEHCWIHCIILYPFASI